MGLLGKVGEIRDAGQLLGDRSGILSGPAGAVNRGRNRVLGKLSGKALVSFNVLGLIFWAEAMVFLRNAVQEAAASETWAGTAVNYAKFYEYGLFDKTTTGGSPRKTGGVATGGHRHAPFFFPAVFKVMAGFRGRGGGSPPTNARSGIYQGSQYISDMKSIVSGDVAGRIARRTAGQATSAFFLGTLSNPDRDIFEVMGKRVVHEARQNVKKLDLVDTGCLRDSFATGNSLGDMERKSIRQCAEALSKAGFLEELGDRASATPRR